MAKAKDLAALAGLAGLAYAMRNKDKDSESTADTGDEADRLKARKPAEEGPRRQITDYMAKAPLDGTEMYPSGVMGGARQPKSVRTATSTPAADNTTAAAMPSGVMGGTRQANADARNVEAGMSRGTRTTSVAGAGRGVVNPRAVTPQQAMRDVEAGMSRGTRAAAPPFKGGQPGYDEAGNFVGGRRGFDEAGNPMKKGGSVKKMASGGMTASRRADGIASRGKTRGKIC
jgi:hypothetical protein